MSNLLAWEQDLAPCNCLPCLLGPRREKLLDVLRWAAQGLTINETASVMGYSRPSIKRWRTEITERLEVTNITQAVAAAIREELI